MSDDFDFEAILEWPEMKDVKDELNDPKYLTRSHGSGATYALKCRGPLCRKTERDKRRKRTEAKAIREGRTHEERERLYDRDALLDAITEWHKLQIFNRRVIQSRQENSA